MWLKQAYLELADALIDGSGHVEREGGGIVFRAKFVDGHLKLEKHQKEELHRLVIRAATDASH